MLARRTHWLKQALLGPGNAVGIRLTFDDGPHPNHTSVVLQQLETHDQEAAFFLIGQNVLQYGRPDYGRHTLGNHTYSHPRLGWFDLRGAEREIARCQAILPEATQFRAPFGRLTPGLWRATRRHGLPCMHWTLDSGDWKCRSLDDARTCAAEVIRLLRDGDTVLFHDSHPWIEPILDAVLPVISRNDLASRSEVRV